MHGDVARNFGRPDGPYIAPQPSVSGQMHVQPGLDPDGGTDSVHGSGHVEAFASGGKGILNVNAAETGFSTVSTFARRHGPNASARIAGERGEGTCLTASPFCQGVSAGFRRTGSELPCGGILSAS